jgi:hypothetical protein
MYKINISLGGIGMAKIRKAGINFLNFFKKEEVLPSEFMEYSNNNHLDNIKNSFYIGL